MSYVQQIGQFIKDIEANYEKYDGSAFNNGGVAEHTAMGHKKLLKEVIDMFKAIAVSSDLFGSEFSMNEMNQIVGLAEKLAGSPYNENALNEDGYKPLISRMKVIFGEKRALHYKSEVDKLKGLIVRVENMLKEEKRVSSMKEVIEGINAQLEDIANSQEQAKAGLVGIQDQIAESVNVLTNANKRHKEIEENRSAIVAFFGEIDQNQKALKTLQTDSAEFLLTMKKSEEEYKEKREKNLQESQVQKNEFFERLEKHYAEYLKKRDEMEKTAEEMLGLANASGLAAAFSQRINKWHLLWLLGAFLFIMGAIVIALHTSGIDIPMLSGMNPVFGDIWERISLTTSSFLAAYFCAAQYLKSDRTLEDYQYKKALAQSMPAFIEQLGKDDEKYRDAYLSLALQQMLQDPLRKKHDVPLPLKDFLKTLFEKSPKDKPEKKDGDS